MLRRVVRHVVHTLWDISHRAAPCTLIPAPNLAASTRDALRETADFFAQAGMRIRIRERASWRVALSSSSLLVAGQQSHSSVRAMNALGRCWTVDPDTEPLAAWHWHRVLMLQIPMRAQVIQDGRRKLDELRSRAHTSSLPVYIFGTGPSLDLASDLDFSDGLRIMCNTAVKNVSLLDHVKPHVIVAGDALYHFGDSEHARAFRADLYRALERHGCLFVLPAEFFTVVRSEMPSDLRHLLVPIPQGNQHGLQPGLAKQYALPDVGNVLNRLLLPLALYLGRDIRLLGFDGRKPGDTGFWTNSSLNSYPDLLELLKLGNRAFFENLVPADNPYKYVNELLGSTLADEIALCEQQGWRFSLLAPSALPGLASVSLIEGNNVQR